MQAPAGTGLAPYKHAYFYFCFYFYQCFYFSFWEKQRSGRLKNRAA